MSYSFNYSDINPSNISIIVNKEAQMQDPKGGNPLSYRTGELQYLINGSKHKLIIKGPVCETKSGLFLQKEDEQPQQPAYHQPTIGGYPGQQMFNPQQMAPKKTFKKKINASVPFQLQPNSNTEHDVFINKLNEINKVVNEELFKIKDVIYARQAIQGQQMTNKPLVAYRVDDVTHQIDMEADPTIWCQVKKYEDQMNKVFMLPNKTYACYKDLINTPFTGIPIFSLACFFNQQNRTCKLNLEGFIIKEIKTSIIANDMFNIVDQLTSEDASMSDRVMESYKKIVESKATTNTSCSTDNTSNEPTQTQSVVDLPVVIPQQTPMQPPQTYQPPQTPMQNGMLPQSYQMPQTYQMPQQLPPQSYLR